MKKIICLLLMFLMLPLASFALIGCNNKKYDLTKFYSSYQNIVNKCDNLMLTPANNTYLLDVNSQKIAIDYSRSSTLYILANTESSSYYVLEHLYQQLLDDTLSPLYFFGEAISSSKKVSKNQTTELFTKLKALELDYIDIDYYLGLLINSLDATDDQTINLARLKNLLMQYEEILISANNLAALICDIYFNTILSNSTIDYSNIPYTSLTEGDLTVISVNVRARMYYYKSVYANIYNQLYLRSSTTIDKILTSSTAVSSYAPYSYISGINSLGNKPASSLINDKTSVKHIHEYSIALFNLQNNFDKAYKAFNTAINKITYLDLNQKSSVDELNYGHIIDSFVSGIAFDSYQIIKDLVTLLY